MSNHLSLYAIATDIIKDLSGGQYSTDSKYSLRQVMEKIRQVRAFVIQDYFIKSKFRSVDQNWLQAYTPTYDRNLQNDNVPYTIYTCPRILLLPRGAGLFWAGKEDLITNFSVYESLGHVGNYQNHRITRASDDRYNKVVYENEKLYVFGAPTNRKLVVRAVFENPLDISGFDEETSTYPVSGHMLPIIKEMVKKELSLDIQMPVDTTNDGQDKR